MSENIPESIPTSADPKSKRPVKRQRGPITAAGKQASELDALFANPQREIHLPSGPKSKTLAAPPEIVTNVQGSSAGAGSGEFHVYKASRRREYERLRLMDEETRNEEATKEYDEKREELKKQDAAKLSKNRARRQKAKEREMKKKKGGNGVDVDKDDEGTQDCGTIQKPLEPLKVRRDDDDADGQVETKTNREEANRADEAGITFHDED